MVGARGFEPPTSRSRTVRSTRLSHAPTRDSDNRGAGRKCQSAADRAQERPAFACIETQLFSNLGPVATASGSDFRFPVLLQMFEVAADPPDGGYHDDCGHQEIEAVEPGL